MTSQAGDAIIGLMVKSTTCTLDIATISLYPTLSPTAGAHEISLVYEFSSFSRTRKIRAIPPGI